MELVPFPEIGVGRRGAEGLLFHDDDGFLGVSGAHSRSLHCTDHRFGDDLFRSG